MLRHDFAPHDFGVWPPRPPMPRSRPIPAINKVASQHIVREVARGYEKREDSPERRDSKSASMEEKIDDFDEELDELEDTDHTEIDDVFKEILGTS